MSTYTRLPEEMRGDLVQRRRRAYVRKYELTYSKPALWLPEKFMDQLDACKDEEAKRLLLGKGRKA